MDVTETVVLLRELTLADTVNVTVSVLLFNMALVTVMVVDPSLTVKSEAVTLLLLRALLYVTVMVPVVGPPEAVVVVQLVTAPVVALAPYIAPLTVDALVGILL